MAGEYLAILKEDNNQIAENETSVTKNSSAQVTFSIPVEDLNEHEVSNRR